MAESKTEEELRDAELSRLRQENQIYAQRIGDLLIIAGHAFEFEGELQKGGITLMKQTDEGYNFITKISFTDWREFLKTNLLSQSELDKGKERELARMSNGTFEDLVHEIAEGEQE